MALPFHMFSAIDSDSLYLLSDGRYLPIRNGALGPLMCGFEYCLLEHALASFLQNLHLPQLRFEPAVIWRINTDEHHTSHQRMHMGDQLPSDIHNMPLAGDRIYRRGDYLFVSPSLRERLLDSPFDYLRFSEGFSNFAA